MSAEDIKRIDAELDRIRWYLAHSQSLLDPQKVIYALKTGDAGGVADA